MAEAQPLQPAPDPSATSNTVPVEAARASTSAASNDQEHTKMAQPNIKAMETMLVPGRYAAIFSTYGGCRPYRYPPGPPFEPIVVRSQKIEGVLDFAGYWRRACPMLYYNIFPNSGWSITDLWDGADIHRETSRFLAEVLNFIMGDNDVRARNEARDWYMANRGDHDKVDMVAGDLNQFWDPANPRIFFEKIFTNGELDNYPLTYLWHLLQHLKACMSEASRSQAAAHTAAGTQEMTQANEAANNMQPAASMAMEQPALAESVQQPRAEPGLGAAPQIAPQVAAPFIQEHPAGPPIHPTPAFVEAPPRGPSFAASRPSRRNVNISQPISFGQFGQPPFPEGHHRNFRNRASRSSSNPNTWDHMPPQHQQRRQQAGRIPPGQPSYFHPSMPASGPMTYAHGFPQNHPGATYPSSHTNPAHPRYSQTFQQNMMPHQQPMNHVPAFMDPSLPFFGQGGPDARGAAIFSDMSNNPQYPPPRGMEPHGPVPRHSSYTAKAPKLYDPYAADKPEKAGSALHPPRGNAGKAPQDSFSTSSGRHRDPQTRFGSLSFDDREVHTVSDAHAEVLHHPRTTYPRARTDITNDLESGCDQDRIGPNNNTINHVFIRNFAEGTTEEDIHSFFQKQGKIVPTRVNLRASAGSDIVTHGFVYFNSTADCRRALELSETLLRGKNLVVNVPRQYWMQKDPSRHRYEGQGSEYRASSGPRMPSHGHSKASESAAALGKEVKYSPQDARSDLPRVSYLEQNQGSPHSRKPKNQNPPHVGVVPKHDTQPWGQIDMLASHQHQMPAAAKAQVQPVDAKLVTSSKPLPVPDTGTAKLISSKPMTSSEQSTTGAGPIKAMAHDVSSQVPQVASHDTPAKQWEMSKDVPAMVDAAGVKPSSSHTSRSEANKDIELPSSGVPLSETPVVKVPLPPATASASTTPQKESVLKEAATEGHKTKGRESDGSSASRHQDDAVSDDEQKNDLSFHSAKESQSESVEVTCKDESGSTEKPAEDRPASTAETVPLEPTAMQPDAQEQAGTKTSEVTSESSKTQAHGDKAEDASTKPAAEGGKKHGAKQTESLFPYAKGNKSQAKKDREAKKKDKKKEKGKGKAEKQTPTKKMDVASRSGQPEPVASKSEAEPGAQPEVQPEIAVEQQRGIVPDAPGTESNEKEKELKPIDTALVEAARGKDTDGGDGKAEGQKESQELEGSQIAVAQVAVQKQASDGREEFNAPPSGEPDPMSHKEPDSDKAGEERPNSKGKTAAKSKTTRHLAAVPNIVFSLTRRPSSSKVSTRDATSGASEPESRRESMATQSTIVDLGPAPGPGSSTGQPDSSAPNSVDSSTTTFFTPAQTPSTMGPTSGTAPSLATAPPAPTLAEAPKKKRNRKNKKKAASKGKGVQEFPFNDQMTQVQGGKSYFSRDSQDPAEKGSQSLLQQIQAYMGGKDDMYAKLPESTWGLEDRREPAKFTPRDMTDLVPLPKNPILRQIFEDADLPEKDQVKRRVVGTPGIFHN